MLLREKNDGGIELHLNSDERAIVFNALRYFSGFCSDEDYLMEKIGSICEMMNVLETGGSNAKEN